MNRRSLFRAIALAPLAAALSPTASIIKDALVTMSGNVPVNLSINRYYGLVTTVSAAEMEKMVNAQLVACYGYTPVELAEMSWQRKSELIYHWHTI